MKHKSLPSLSQSRLTSTPKVLAVKRLQELSQMRSFWNGALVVRWAEGPQDLPPLQGGGDLGDLSQTFHVWLNSAGGFTAPETIRLKPDNYSVSHPRSKEGGSLPDPDLSLALIKKEWAHLVANGDRY